MKIYSVMTTYITYVYKKEYVFINKRQSEYSLS